MCARRLQEHLEKSRVRVEEAGRPEALLGGCFVEADESAMHGGCVGFLLWKWLYVGFGPLLQHAEGGCPRLNLMHLQSTHHVPQ